ncbi:hypothetical protein [Novosphingobium sp. BL-52-GroH]|uniref:hypothetical protein n=1 Tax=Novosphingobium sp. BL-52-GroH TaxID=3349877 RepID=UPI00384F8829
MPEEWFDLAYINFDKVILHGRITTGHDEFRVRREAEVEQVLTDEQKDAVQELKIKHNDELNALLSSFVDREAAIAASN